MRRFVIGIVVVLLFICSGFLGSGAAAFETGRIGLGIGGGINFPMLDFSDQSALAAAMGFGFTADCKYQLGNKLAVFGSYNYRFFDTDFLEPPTDYRGGYGKYRFHNFSLGPRIYFAEEVPCSFMDVGLGAYLPYFYIPGEISDEGILPDDMVFGVNVGYGWHTDKIDISLRYHLFKTDSQVIRGVIGSPDIVTPEYFIHYFTFDAVMNLIPDE
ncbi:MAG: hypothetical protein GY855_06430 [candidate division Zixibacteria bacterium]|nr:hypothetical protein [candidate division Zixibacteria bacterium]